MWWGEGDHYSSQDVIDICSVKESISTVIEAWESLTMVEATIRRDSSHRSVMIYSQFVSSKVTVPPLDSHRVDCISFSACSIHVCVYIRDLMPDSIKPTFCREWMPRVTSVKPTETATPHTMSTLMSTVKPLFLWGYVIIVLVLMKRNSCLKNSVKFLGIRSIWMHGRSESKLHTYRSMCIRMSEIMKL